MAAAAASEMAERLEAEDLAAEAGRRKAAEASGRRKAAEASGRRKAGGGTTEGGGCGPWAAAHDVPVGTPWARWHASSPY